MVSTNELVSERFDLTEEIADDAIEKANEFIDQLSSFLTSLEISDVEDLEDIEMPIISPIDFSARPSFTAALEDFPTFNNIPPTAPVMVDIPEIDIDIETENIEFQENVYTAPVVNIGDAPENNVNLESVVIPDKPEYTLPTVPTLDDVVIPSSPVIDIPLFDAVAPVISDPTTPQELSYTEGVYSSDMRLDLFNKILFDLRNGGTGLDVDVETDIYERGIERQRVENEKLYRESENRFSGVGFALPHGVLNSGLQEVSNEISRKTDQLNREITISQAELAQNNTQFTTQQAVQIEGLLMDFFNNQENRSLEASKLIAQNAIDIFNAIITGQRLKLEKYQVEASVFEQRVKAQLTAVEIYKAEIEGALAQSDVQKARVAIYSAQVDGLKTLMSMYAVEMDSVKVQTDVQMAKIETFKAEIEAFIAGTEAEKAKVDIFNSQIESERTRAGVYSEKVKASLAKLEGSKLEAELQSLSAENALKTNQLRIDEYKAKLEGFTATIEMEIKNAQLQVEAFKTEAMAFEVETNAVGMEYEAKMKEASVMISNAELKIRQQVAIIEATKGSYVALKSLQEKGLEGIMNVNAQLAASAMNAVNVSAGQSHGYSDSTSETWNETHTYKEK